MTLTYFSVTSIIFFNEYSVQMVDRNWNVQLNCGENTSKVGFVIENVLIDN